MNRKKIWTINRIWSMAITGVVLILFLFLAIDIWIYASLVAEQDIDTEKLGPVLLLKKTLLDTTAERIESQEALLKNPMYPLIKDPF